jgi:hypothetical protein
MNTTERFREQETSIFSFPNKQENIHAYHFEAFLRPCLGFLVLFGLIVAGFLLSLGLGTESEI